MQYLSYEKKILRRGSLREGSAEKGDVGKDATIRENRRILLKNFTNGIDTVARYFYQEEYFC